MLIDMLDQKPWYFLDLAPWSLTVHVKETHPSRAKFGSPVAKEAPSYRAVRKKGVAAYYAVADMAP